MDGLWEASFNMAKVVELALNNGKDPLSGVQVGPETGEAESFETYGEFHEAVRKQLEYLIPFERQISRVSWNIYREQFPTPFASALEGREGARKLLSLIKTYMDLGGYHIQFNCVSSETLKDARLYPEEHRDLVVRVAGFSAFFIHLDEETQDEIIRRTEIRFDRKQVWSEANKKEGLNVFTSENLPKKDSQEAWRLPNGKEGDEM